MRESAAASHIRLFAAQNNHYLMRNNVGVLTDINGRPVRYGLCNESKQQNQKLKSSDLIGITPTVVTQDMVGKVVGIFTAVETKRTDWRFTGTDREIAQQNFINLVLQHGGKAGFANDVDSYRRIVL